MFWVDKMQAAIDFIENNLFEPINTEVVGKAIHYAPSHFSGFFSAIVGYTVGEYIRFRRLSVAAEQLEKENATVTDMAFKCGYETIEAFSKAFKRLFGCAPSQYAKSGVSHPRFSPIAINFSLQGGFSMTRNLIPGLRKVDWSDTRRQSEYVNSAVSVLNGLGESTDYDYVCAASGSAFRTSFSTQGWNFGNYHASYVPDIFEHTFNVFGYSAKYHRRSDFKTDSRLIMESIDRGIPVLTIGGVVNCSDTCLISGYDNDGAVLLGYNPFMYIEDDHSESPDDTGYFRKSDWHNGYFAEYNPAGILIIGDKREKPAKEKVFGETLRLIKDIIARECIIPGQYNGLAAHGAFSNALMTYEWADNFEPYMCVMCSYKQYLDRQYAGKFFKDNDRDDLAAIYGEIAERCEELARIIPQDFSAGDMFADKEKLRPYCDTLLAIRSLEEKALSVI